MTSYVDRVASRAAELTLARVVLTVIAAPFYALGALAAVTFVAVSWCWSALAVGFADVRGRARGGG